MAQFIIPARCCSDDHKVEAHFDALKFFEQAIEVDLIELTRQGFGGDFAADYVAQFMQNHDEGVERVFTYLSFKPENFGEPVCLECFIEERPALLWLKEHRPTIWQTILEDDLIDPAAFT